MDEALSAGAESVQFGSPVPVYVDNFIGFPVGETVPLGYYDREAGAWMPAESGRVIEIVGMAAGLAELDVDGDGLADDAATALGVTDAEREQLALLYGIGQELWRVEVSHFTAWDCNWGFGPPEGACGPGGDPEEDPVGPGDPELNDPENGDDGSDNSCPDEDKCVIELQSQVLRESLPVAGAGFDMHYSSSRAYGYAAARQLHVPLASGRLSASLKAIELNLDVAGRSFHERFEDDPINLLNLGYDFTWDGRDAYGRRLEGRHPVSVSIGYQYDGAYRQSDRFGYSGNGTPITGDRDALTVTLWRSWEGTLGAWTGATAGLGGWSLEPHHAYDPQGRVLHRGDGTRRRAEALPRVVNAFAGTGNDAFSGDGGPALEAEMDNIPGIATAPDGSLYVIDRDNYRIRRIAPDGSIGTVLYYPYSYFNAITVCPDEHVYLSTYQKLWRLEDNGTIVRVAGSGVQCAPPYADACGDNGPALDAVLSASALACGADGGIYLKDSLAVRRIGPDGVISRVAGSRTSGFSPDGTPAVDARIVPWGIAVDREGRLLFIDADGSTTTHHSVRRVEADGTLLTLGGGGSCSGNACGDGGPAIEARLYFPKNLAVAEDGTIFINDTVGGIRAVDTEGNISRWIPTGCYSGDCGDSGPAASGSIGYTTGLALGSDDKLFFAHDNRVRVIGPALPGASPSDIVLADTGGSDLYVFDHLGRHLRTVDSVTATDRYTFAYTTDGVLASITDRDGNATTIERDTQGTPTKIVAPHGQETVLALDADGMLATVQLPTGAQASMTYGDGLMTVFNDLRGFEHSYTYDPDGRLLTARDAAGGQTTLSRTKTEDGHQVTRTTAEGRTSTYAVGESTLESTLVNTFANGTQSSQSVGLDGTSTTVLADGRIVTTELSPDPRFGMQAPVSTTTTVTPSGRTRTVAQQRTATLANAYDPLSLVTQTETTTINGRTFTSVFDAATRTTTRTTPVGRISTTTVDEQGRVIHTAPPGILPTDMIYDPQGRISEMLQGTRQRTFGYDAQTGYLLTVTDALSQQTLYERDAMGRATRQTLPDGEFIDFGYDGKGNMISLTPPQKPVHELLYTPVDLLASYDPPVVSGSGTTSTTYGYNLDRQLESVLRPDGQSIARAYDAVTGELTSLTLPTGTASFGYLTTGQLASISGPYGVDLAFAYDGPLRTDVTWSGEVSGTVHTDYDNDFRPSSESVNGTAVAFGYDNDGLLTSAGALTRTLDPATAQLASTTVGDVSEAYGYNDYGELSTYDASHFGSSMLSVSYTRDALGRIASKTETTGGETHTYVYRYDLRGRLYEVELDGVVVESYGYDANGNRLGGTYDDQDRLLSYGSKTYSYTANGELSSCSDGTQYTYDVQGALLSVELPDGRLIEYVIDGQGRRVGKKVDGVLQWGLLYRSSLQPVALLDGSGALVDRYVYGSSRNVPEYLVRGGTLYRIITDHLGSLRLVVNVSTGAVMQRMSYDAYGRVVVDSIEPGWEPLPFGFAGGVFDRDTGLVRFGARDYDAAVGRWTGKDPIGFGGGDWNLLAYVSNDPVNSLDSTGKKINRFLDHGQVIECPVGNQFGYVLCRMQECDPMLPESDSCSEGEELSDDYAKCQCKCAQKAGCKCAGFISST